MNRCTVTSGFFVLGHCGRTAVAPCAQCGRPTCQEHYGPDGLCAECRAAASPTRSPYDEQWVRGYRRGYYSRSSQTYGDATWYSGFDEYDRGAFNPGQGHYLGDYDHDGDDGFVDS
ncbi:hypothetical protein [Thermomonospora echinospora]|uniref:hypothetical protein n=1 Tax=Thermomonospora echinospora TaxID=1992 RepID=UPI000CDE6B57|nr:hypothetical protein [Thermomonospora echinospora]